MKKRILSIITTLTLCLSLLPAFSTAASAADTHTHSVCGATHTDIGDHTAPCEAVTYQPLSSVLTKVEDSGNSYYYGILDGGSYYVDLDTIYLKAPGTIDETTVYAAITIKGNVNLCLNGKTLRGYGDASGGLFHLHRSSESLTLCDCGQYGTITGAIRNINGAGNGAGINVGDRTLRMFGGTITGNKADSDGGGVHLGAGGVLKMYGGAITGNTASADGDDVWSGGAIVLSGAANIGKLYAPVSNISIQNKYTTQLSGALTNGASITLENIRSDGVVADGVNGYTVMASDAEKIKLPAGAVGKLLVDAPNNRLVLGTDFAAATVTLSLDSFTYNREEQKPEITVKVGDTTLIDGTHYTVDWPEDCTNAGTKTVTIHGKYEGDSKYAGSQTVTYTITPKVITPVVEGVQESYPYTGSAIQPTITVKDGDAVLSEDTDYGVTYAGNTDVNNGGSVTVTLEGNYQGTTTVNFDITKVDASITAAPTPNSLTYDGTAQNLVSAGSTDDGEMQYSLNGTDYSSTIPQGTAAGNYTVYYKVVGDANHNGTDPASLPVTIAKADASVTVVPTAVQNLTYTGEPQALVKGGTATGGEMQYSLDNANWSVEIPTATKAGNYTVWYKVVGNDNYNDTTPVNVTATVLQAPLTIKAKNQGITYGMSIFQGTSNVIVTGLMSGDTLTDITLTSSGQNVGHWVITPSNATISGSADNYYITYETGALTISTAMHDALTAEQQKLLSDTAGDYTFDVSTVSGFPTDGGTLSFAVTQDDNYAKAAATPFVGSVLHYTVAAPQSKNTTDNIVVTVSSTNYADFDVTIPMIFVDAAEVATPTGVPDTITYGDSFTLNAIAMNSGDNGVWTWESSDPAVLSVNMVSGGSNISEARVTAVGVGSGVTITAKYVSDVSIGSASTASLTVGKAALTVKPKNISIYNGAAMPTPEVEYVGLKNGDAGATVAALTSGTLAMEIKAADGTTALADTTVNGIYQIVFTGAPTFSADNYAVTTAEGTLTISTRPSSGDGGGGYTPSTPPTQSVTIPISGDDNTIHVDAEVKGDKATVDSVDLSQLDKVIGDHVEDVGTVTIDFSGLDSSEPITTVEIPSNVVKEIADAVADPSNDAHSFEVILSNGLSIEFDAEALGEKAAQADGLDITISIENAKDTKPNSKQEAALKGRPAYEISVTSGGEHISDMGGQITVHAPYELQDGEHPNGILVWYVDEEGKRERCETSYDNTKKRVNWKTDHLSLYMIDHCPSATFADLDVDAWYHKALDYVIENGMMAGYGETFGPNDSITRGQIVTILHRLEGVPVVNYLMTYEDVDQEKYYAEAIRWATSEGIVAGYGNGKFGPDDPITRQQLATILWRYSQHKGYDVSVGEDTNILSYEDAFDISEYAIPAMQWACGAGVMGGYGNGYLGPNDGATRAQAAQMLKNFMEKAAK